MVFLVDTIEKIISIVIAIHVPIMVFVILNEPIKGSGEIFSAANWMWGIGALKKPNPNALPKAPPASENTSTARAAKIRNKSLKFFNISYFPTVKLIFFIF